MRDIDPEGLIIDILKDDSELDGVPIYAGWPGWDVPSGLDISTSLLDIAIDSTIDSTGTIVRTSAPVIVNIWDVEEERARRTAVHVVEYLQHKRHIPTEGAEIWLEIDDMKPLHEPEPTGTIYRYMITVNVKTYEEV